MATVRDFEHRQAQSHQQERRDAANVNYSKKKV
jgi:hypothetical protein